MTCFRLTDRYHGGTAAGVRPRVGLSDRLADIPAQQPRPLTAEELQRLHRLGFETLAAQLAAGTCDKCGLNKLGTGHRQICQQQPDQQPRRTVRQPWEPRPPRHLRDAA